MGSRNDSLKEYIKDIVNKYKYSFIPLRLVKDEDIKSGKIPAISGWSKYCDELPTDEEIDSWNIIGTVSGVGICCGEASNLGCVDIDTEDPELNRRLKAIMPANSPSIIGNPKRGGKYLFKLREFPNDPILNITKTKIGNAVDIFVSGAQIAVPPSIHTCYQNGEKLSYSWLSNYNDGEYPVIDDLPVLDEDILTAIKLTLDGQTPSQIVHSVRPGSIDLDKEETEGRYNHARKRIAQLQRQLIDPTEAVKILIKEDLERNGIDNMVFKTKVRYTASPEINCYYWYINQLKNNNAKKPIAQCEVPLTLKNEPIIDLSVVNEGWAHPILPDSNNSILPPFDLNVVPPAWRELVKDAAESNSLPYEACFFLLLTELSAVIGNKRIIQWKKQNKEWREAHNIWSVYIARSGTRKTQLLRLLSEPMRKLQKKINDDYEKKKKEIVRLQEVVEPQIAELEKRLKEEAVIAIDSNDNKEYILETQMKIDALKDSIEIEPRKQLVVKSATTEKLLILMQQNQDGIMFAYNELAELIGQFSKKGYETQRQIIMDSWDGLGSASYQTKNSGDVFIDTACASLYGAIQPSIFRKHVLDIYNGKNDDGFWQRPFIISNESNKAVEAIDVEFDHDKYYKAYEIFYKAYEAEKSDAPIGSHYLAYEEYMEFESRVNNMSFSEGNDAIGAFWGKFTGKIVKIASLIEFIKNDGVFVKEISLESFRSALYIMDRQITHIRNLFPRDSVYGLSDVVYMMRAGIIESGTTTYKLSRSHNKYFGNKEQSNALIAELVERNIIKVEKRGTSTYIEISPYIF